MIEETNETTIHENDTPASEGLAPASESNIVNFPAQPAAVQPPPPFVTLALDSKGVMTLYSAMQTYHQTLAARDDLPAVERVVELMKLLRPAAVEATKLFQQQQGGQQ